MRGILFDLDGTLLNIELDTFLQDYYRALVPVLQTVAPDLSAESAIRALDEGVRAMMVPHPGQTNEDVFAVRFGEIAGVDLTANWAPFNRFYEEVFPSLQHTARPASGARACIERALELGLRVAIATNPIFPLAAIRHRLSWAGLEDLEFHMVTSYETMHATKPHADYFRETALMIDVPPQECIMVGDDRVLDLAAADIGMRTFYVGSDDDAVADYRGDLHGLTKLIDQLLGG